VRRIVDDPVIAIPAGGVWPDAQSQELPPFSWVHIENRGAAGNDLVVGLGSTPDATNYWRKVAAQTARTMNCAGNGKGDVMQKKLWIKNLGAAAINVLLEISDTPIVDIEGPATNV